jgi:nucleoid DNA-binding protein
MITKTIKEVAMPRETISGFYDCAKALSVKRGYTMKYAHSVVNDVLAIMVDEIDRLGGVQFVNLFTIKKHYKHERQGVNPSTAEPITIQGRYTLKLTVGQGLSKRLNPTHDPPTSTSTIPFKLVGRHRPKLNAAKRPSHEEAQTKNGVK